MPFIYKCIFEMDDGCNKYPNSVEFIISKRALEKNEIEDELYKRKPYNQYDVLLRGLRVIPIVLIKDITILGRDC